MTQNFKQLLGEKLNLLNEKWKKEPRKTRAINHLWDKIRSIFQGEKGMWSREKVKNINYVSRNRNTKTYEWQWKEKKNNFQVIRNLLFFAFSQLTSHLFSSRKHFLVCSAYLFQLFLRYCMRYEYSLFISQFVSWDETIFPFSFRWLVFFRVHKTLNDVTSTRKGKLKVLTWKYRLEFSWSSQVGKTKLRQIASRVLAL